MLNEEFDAKGYYDALELPYNASSDEIKQSYRNIAKVWHPDQNSSEEALEKFQKISVAYDILKDENKRLTYDLLSQIYTSDNFPDMFSLKPYKNRDEQEDTNVRNIKLKRVVGKIIKTSSKDEFEICSFKEAKTYVLRVSLLNWLLGWWSLGGVISNIKAIFYNIKNVDNKKDNIKLLIHNAVAYWQEDKKVKALESAIQANIYANTHQKHLLNKFSSMMGVKAKKSSKWNYASLRLVQLIFPALILSFLLVPLARRTVDVDELQKYMSQDKEKNYYREVKFSVTGGRTFDDMLVSKVLDIPVDVNDTSFLYHLVERTSLMHAPGDEFDVARVVAAKTTVRVTGYTPDKVWYRIMLDDGEMGFVKRISLKKGVGADIPSNSKIYVGSI